MYTVYSCINGYFSKEDDFGNEIYSLVPGIITDFDEADRIAKKINDKTGEAVNVYTLKETNGKHYPKKTLNLKDLKKGDTFQYLTNLDCIYMVVSDEEIVCVKGDAFRNVGKFFPISQSTRNYEVKKVKL